NSFFELEALSRYRLPGATPIDRSPRSIRANLPRGATRISRFRGNRLRTLAVARVGIGVAHDGRSMYQCGVTPTSRNQPFTVSCDGTMFVPPSVRRRRT